MYSSWVEFFDLVSEVLTRAQKDRMKTPSPFALVFTAFVLFVFAAFPAKADTALVGSTWLVEDIEGGGVIDSLQSTLTFDSAEKVIGMGGCNNFLGAVKIDGLCYQIGPSRCDPEGLRRRN